MNGAVKLPSAGAPGLEGSETIMAILGSTRETGVSETLNADGTRTVRSTTTTDVGQGRAAGPVDGALTAAELKRERDQAYEQGRRDGIASRKSNPILTLLVVLLAVFGLVMAVLAIRNGSFSGAGAEADRLAAEGAQEAREAAVSARDSAGEAAQDTGAAIQREGAEVERAAEAERR